MHTRPFFIALLVIIATACGAAVRAQTLAAAPAQNATPAPAGCPELRATRITTPPVIDGLLDDDGWKDSRVETGEWSSYTPLYGDTIPQHTTVWIGYDANNIYFAFKCDDPQPGGIKTSITRRDNIGQDDWVGLSLDALGTGQTSYHMMVNPSGVQLDMLNSVAGGEDQNPDWVWESAGRLTDTGYAVEIRLPLQSIRFAGGQDTRMGILFWRRVSRIGVSVSWPALTPSAWVFDRNASLHFSDIAPRLPREVIPSVTVTRNDTRDTPSRWTSNSTGAVGFGAKVGLTPGLTLDATVNPDFSQVESDAFQVAVNQRYPLFFSEKRPFFMEGAGIFALTGVAVNTRNIVDPIFGAKLTGNVGRVNFGTLSAIDQAPGRTADPGSPEAGKDRVFNIARAQVSLGPGSYVGTIATDTRFAGSRNTVIGADAVWRLTPTQIIKGFLLDAFTVDRVALDEGLPDGGTAGDTTAAGSAASGAGSPAGVDGTGTRAARSDLGAELTYSYDTQRVSVFGRVEHFDRTFRMDTAFINRVGFTNGQSSLSYNLYPDKTKLPWLRRVQIFTTTQRGRDRAQHGDEWLNNSGVSFSFTRQGGLSIYRSAGREAWASQRFKIRRWSTSGSVQLYRWLYLTGSANQGYATYYDPVAPFQGRSRSMRGGFTLQPSGRLSQEVSYQRDTFDRTDTGARIYTLNLLYLHTTYHFTRQFFLRGIEQYDSSQHRILTDFLASYELRPGTVVYAGYGSLIEQRTFQDDHRLTGHGDYLTTGRGLFFKASYLYRF